MASRSADTTWTTSQAGICTLDLALAQAQHTWEVLAKFHTMLEVTATTGCVTMRTSLRAFSSPVCKAVTRSEQLYLHSTRVASAQCSL